MKNNFSEELEFAKYVAQEVGKIHLKYFRKSLRVIRKSLKEFVSDVDMESQDLAYRLLSKEFDYPVASEELKVEKIDAEKYFWVVDPVDGTHNFIAGLPNFGVSIALANRKDFIVGVIYIPYLKELFYAEKGKGAFMNGERINVSKNDNLEKSMITYDNQFHLSGKSFEKYKHLVANCFTTRILGSAVYDMGLVASGRIDSRIWNRTKMFDFAAGAVIIKEAGGKITDFQNKAITLESKEVVASNGLVHDKLIDILNKGE